MFDEQIFAIIAASCLKFGMQLSVYHRLVQFISNMSYHVRFSQHLIISNFLLGHVHKFIPSANFQTD